jgi:hypothetical protein
LGESGEGEAGESDQSADARQGPSAVVEFVDAVFEFVEASLGLVGSLDEQGERTVDPGEPDLDRSAQPLKSDGCGVVRRLG